MTILEKFFDGDISALARVISHIENRGQGYRELMAQLYRSRHGAVRIGFTGPPGAGKSTIVDCVARQLLASGKKVAVIAVDPSSPFTGGALLGDRVRFKEMSPEAPIYFRSMATRGSRGGLASATDNAAVALDAFGYDYILIETVGVGQVELDIVDNCDLVVVILVPESGDAVQAMKAGLTEIANIFVVNKADRPGAERVVADLTMMLENRRKQRTSGAGEWDIPIVATTATEEKNIDILMTRIDERLASKQASGAYAKARERQMTGKLTRILQERFIADTQERLADSGDIEKTVSAILSGSDDPYSAADRLYGRK